MNENASHATQSVATCLLPRSSARVARDNDYGARFSASYKIRRGFPRHFPPHPVIRRNYIKTENVLLSALLILRLNADFGMLCESMLWMRFDVWIILLGFHKKV